MKKIDKPITGSQVKSSVNLNITSKKQRIVSSYFRRNAFQILAQFLAIAIAPLKENNF